MNDKKWLLPNLLKITRHNVAMKGPTTLIISYLWIPVHLHDVTKNRLGWTTH